MSPMPVNMANYRRRKAWNYVAFFGTAVCAGLVLSALLFILGYLWVNGISAVNWNFFIKLPKPVGEIGGGMANALLGSAELLALAGLFGLPFGVFAGIYLSEFGHNKFGGFVRYMTDILNGVPSIVMGIFAYTLFVLPMRKFTMLAGGAALGIMMIPIAVRTTEEFLNLVPQTVREAAYALGLPRWKTVVFIVIPTAMRGIMTGIMLDFARVAGETAPLLFTAFGNRYWNRGLLEPTSSLPVMIYTYAISPYPDWHRQAWAAGLVLLTLVFVMGAAARLALRKHAA
jgi:phosphate transport system permease protein